MKSVTLIAVLLVAAAVASADIRLVVEPATAASRNATLTGPVSGFIVKAVMDPGDAVADFAITAVDIRFDGALLQSWLGAFDEDTEEWSYPSTPFGTKQGTIRDSLFIMNVTAPVGWALPPINGELAKGTTEAEDQIGGSIVVVGSSQYMYGAGTWLGAYYEGLKNRQAYGVSGDATTVEIAQLVISTADLNATGIHIVADVATKTQGGRHFDTYIGAPEPASLGLLAVGGVMALIRRRRA